MAPLQLLKDLSAIFRGSRFDIVVGKSRVVTFELHVIELSELWLPTNSALHREQALRFFTLPPSVAVARIAELLHAFRFDLYTVTR